MKTTLIIIIFLITTTPLFSQSITIGEDGIVRCKGVQIGTTGIVAGITYEVVDRELLNRRRDEGKDLTKVCVSNVTDMSELFKNITFNQAIGNWDVSSVTNMYEMFYLSSFNQPIGNWSVYNVKSLSYMFSGGTYGISNGSNRTIVNHPFNHSINRWCVINIKSEPDSFSRYSLLTIENKPTWGTCLQLSPSKTTKMLPSNNATDVSTKSIFSWRKDSPSSKYQLQVAEEYDPIVIDTLISNTTFVSNTSLKQNTNYYWRIRGFNDTIKQFGEWSSIWKFTTNMGTSIDIDEQPTQFSLYQNYPNPFNPTTQIKFSIPQTTQVQLDVYSILGQKVSTLINGTMNSGTHTVSFDGKNLSSGVYIYRITTPESTQSRIMNLV